MLSLSYLFEVIPDAIEYAYDPATAAVTKVWKAKMAEYQDKQTWGRKIFDKLNSPNIEQEKAFDAAKESAAKRLKK
jgi:hypothetical protein